MNDERKAMEHGRRRDRRVHEAVELLDAGVERILDGEEFKRYLAFAARFHRYSANNSLLILLQTPGATRVAGYRRLAGTRPAGEARRRRNKDTRAELPDRRGRRERREVTHTLLLQSSQGVRPLPDGPHSRSRPAAREALGRSSSWMLPGRPCARAVACAALRS